MLDCEICKNKGWVGSDPWSYCVCSHGTWLQNRHGTLHKTLSEGHLEILKFNTNTPVESASKPPSSWYSDQDIFDLEQERIFNNGWFCAGPSEMVHDGGYRVPKHLPFPVVITRENGNLHAFHNVCLHHKAEVASGIDTRVTKMTCKYHGWTYGLDGKLRGTPHLKERPACLAKGLSEMSVAKVGPLLFVNRQPDVPFDVSFLDCDFSWDNMRGVDARTYIIDCNWKIYIDNYLDGGYHVPTIHKTLTGQLDLSSYKIEVKDGYVVQSVEGDEKGDFQERIGDRALYVWRHPNVMFNRYGPWLSVVSVIPLSPNQTKVKCYYFLEKDYTTEGCDRYTFVKRSIEASSQVTEEDIGICESAQIGACATPNDRGVYVPKFESGQFYFHQKLAEALV